MFTIKRIIRVLALLCMIFVFTPSFLVSCSNQSVEISVMSTVQGISGYGEEIVEPHYGMLLCLLIPVAIIAILFIKKLSEPAMARIILAITSVDVIIWMLFRYSVMDYSEGYMLKVETTSWYVINMIVLILIFLSSGLVALKKIDMATDFIVWIKGENAQKTLKEISDSVGHIAKSVSNMAEGVASSATHNKQGDKQVVGSCEKCEAPIYEGAKFCISCGSIIPETAKQKSNDQKKVTLETCKECGNQFEDDGLFCISCGTKRQ